MYRELNEYNKAYHKVTLVLRGTNKLIMRPMFTCDHGIGINNTATQQRHTCRKTHTDGVRTLRTLDTSYICKVRSDFGHFVHWTVCTFLHIQDTAYLLTGHIIFSYKTLHTSEFLHRFFQSMVRQRTLPRFERFMRHGFCVVHGV